MPSVILKLYSHTVNDSLSLNGCEVRCGLVHGIINDAGLGFVRAVLSRSRPPLSALFRTCALAECDLGPFRYAHRRGSPGLAQPVLAACFSDHTYNAMEGLLTVHMC